MVTQIESIGALERRLNLSVPMADVDRQVQQKLRNLSATVRMPGFRPGKVPMKMIQQSYGPQVRAEVMGEAVSKALSDAVAEHKLRIAGQPRIEPREESDEAVVGFSAIFEVYPEVQLKDIAGVQVDRFECTVGDAEIDKTIEILRKQRTQWEPANRAAADGDRVTIDFAGSIDGEPFQGGSAEDFAFVLGEGRMLSDLENGVRGMSEGEQRAIDVAFPAEYGAKELAGKTARFDVTAKKVEAPKLPELDADFARALGVADGDLDKMRSDVRTNLEREVNARLRARTKGAVMDALPAIADFEIPKALVEAESAQLAERAREDLKARGVDVKNVPIPPDAFKEQAEKRVRLGLIVAEIVRANQLQAKPDQLRKQIEEFAQAYENPAEVVRWYFSDRERLAEVEALVVEQNVVDWVLQKANVNEKRIAFDELMTAG